MMKASCYAVIFSSQRREGDSAAYEAMAKKMVELAQKQKGFLGIESVRDQEGNGITVSYWQTLKDIDAWRADAQHQEAQKRGAQDWYSSYKITVCEVLREKTAG